MKSVANDAQTNAEMSGLQTPRVFTIPASAPFLPTLITALVSGKLGLRIADDPLALAATTLYLPTRRACRLMRDAFLDVLKTDAAILPRIVALGDIDEDEIAFAEAATGELAADALALPPALGGLERRLLLTELVAKWANAPEVHGAGGGPLVAQTPAAACALADDLARLIDDMTTRGVSWDRLDDLVPDMFDRYWQLTLRFLQIAREAWPRVLAERDCIEPAKRRDALIKAEAARLAQQDRRSGDRGRLHRLDPRDRRIDRDHRAAAARRRGPAGPRYRSRRGLLAADCRR